MKSIHRFALCAQICIAASFVTAGSASAALISSGVAVLSTTSTSQLLNTGTKVFAWDVASAGAPAAPTVNGIGFSNTQPTSPVTVSTTGFAATGEFTSTYNSNADMNNLLTDVAYTNSGNGVTSTVTLSGLTVGQEYSLQFLHYQEGAGAASRQMEVFFGNTSGATTGIFAAGNTAYISTFDFTADTTSQLFTLRGFNNNADDRAILNAATLFAVPEPSAALLGGLGMLALLRRRRN